MISLSTYYNMKITTIELTETEKQALEQGYKLGETAVYRQRCHLILLRCTLKPPTGKNRSTTPK
jgi:hypothetical protein